VLQRAQERAAAKNLEPGTVSNFAVHPVLSDSHMVSVTHDCGMAFERESHTVTETISLIRVKEEAHVALPLAAFCKEVEATRAARSTVDAGATVVGATAEPLLGGDDSVLLPI
jgi:hypothetical protein